MNQFSKGAKLAQKRCEIKTIKANVDGTFEEMGCFDVPDKKTAMRRADNLQKEFDDDCDPVRVYAYVEGNPVPFYAGLASEY